MAQAIYHNESDCKHYLWNRVSFLEMSIELSRFTTWFFDHLCIDTPVECLWSHIKSELLNLLDKYLPSKVVKNRTERLELIIKQLSKWKKKCYKTAKANNSSSEWLCYQSLKKEIQQECRKAHDSYMTRSLFDPFRTGRKKNFSIASNLFVKKIVVYQCYRPMGSRFLIMWINKYFVSAFTHDNNSSAPDLGLRELC